jgi:hypothetical protein
MSWSRQQLATGTAALCPFIEIAGLLDSRGKTNGKPNPRGVSAMAATDVTRDDARTGNNGRTGFGRVARRLVTETKQAFKTTEFWAMLGLVVAILVSAAVIKGGDNGTDQFIAKQAWLYVSILGGAYFVSRGLAKAGSPQPYDEDSDTNR